MNKPIAVIHVTTRTESSMNGTRELTRLYKITSIAEDTGDDKDQLGLFEYNNSGYRFLEVLGTRNSMHPTAIIEEAKNRIPDYALDEEIIDMSVTER